MGPAIERVEKVILPENDVGVFELDIWLWAYFVRHLLTFFNAAGHLASWRDGTGIRVVYALGHDAIVVGSLRLRAGCTVVLTALLPASQRLADTQR